MKKLLITALAAVMAVSMLAACGGGSKTARNADETKTSSAATEDPKAEPTDEPAASATDQTMARSTEEGGGATVNPDLQTADEAANDQVTIQNEIDSIKGLIAEGLYDDAMMQARALMTKNLTDADKELIRQYMDQLESQLGVDVSGLVN